jgi:hypothetical protein
MCLNSYKSTIKLNICCNGVKVKRFIKSKEADFTLTFVHTFLAVTKHNSSIQNNPS